MAQRNSAGQAATAAIEICGPVLHLTVLGPPDGDGQRVVQTRSSHWQKTSHSPHSAAGIEELQNALRTMLDESPQVAGRFNLTLNGDYCVTRVATGTSEQVRRELAQLEQRSAGYLTLGHGRKSLATRVESLDARHQHALLCVTNRALIDALVELGDEHHLELDRIEPSLVAVSRIASWMGRDSERPVLIANIGATGVELGISHRGRLLLDYRPGGKKGHEDVAAIVSAHLSRLNRYCTRYYDRKAGGLKTVLLFGPAEVTEPVSAKLATDGKLSPEVVQPANVDERLRFAESNVSSEVCASLGTCLASEGGEDAHAGPNLMDRFRAENLDPIWPELRRIAWPIAAALLVAAGLFGINLYERSRCRGLEAETAALRPAIEKTIALKRRLGTAQRMSAHLHAIDRAIENPDWTFFVRSVAGAMPRDVWLGSVIADAETGITIRGRSYTEQSVFELARWLETGPTIATAALNETRDARVEGDDVVEFRIECEMADLNGDMGDDDGNG